MIKDNGIGLGYRPIHHEEVLKGDHNIEWFEGLADNYLDEGGIPFYKLMAIREKYPMVLHSVGMSLAAPEPLDKDYMRRLKMLKDNIKPEWMSDHLCWSSWGNAHHHDLLPVPMTSESVKRISRKIKQAQDMLEDKICIENLSASLGYQASEMSEAQFLAAVAEEADCNILLDVNNIVVSGKNFGFVPKDYIKHVPFNRVKQIHLAGYLDKGTHYLDTHGDHVFPNVWELYEYTMQQVGPIPTMVEWDQNIPDFSVVVEEINKAKAIMDKAEKQLA